MIFKVIGQRSRSPGQIFRRGDTPRFALPLFVIYCCFFLFSGNPEKKPWNAVYAAWGGRDRCHGKFIRGVCVFGIGDLNELASKKELFANKFYSDYQYLALDCLEEYIYNKTFIQLVFESFYYKQLPFTIKD